MNYRLDHGEIEADRSGGRARDLTDSAVEEESPDKAVLFWCFPRGKGSIQPWRRRLWELQNNSDRE
jgi:hypothetical protein